MSRYIPIRWRYDDVELVLLEGLDAPIVALNERPRDSDIQMVLGIDQQLFRRLANVQEIHCTIDYCRAIEHHRALEMTSSPFEQLLAKGYDIHLAARVVCKYQAVLQRVGFWTYHHTLLKIQWAYWVGYIEGYFSRCFR